MPGANGSGGKRNGAGAKPGHPGKVLKDGSLALTYGEKVKELAKQYLEGSDIRMQFQAWKELLPYVLRKQPTVVESRGELTINYARAREELAAQVNRIAAAVTTAGSPEQN